MNCFSRRGFTLIELLLVIGILSLLAAVVVSAVNPTHQLAGARDAQRWSDVTTILDGFNQYAIDHGGRYQPIQVDGSPLEGGCQFPLPPAEARKLCKAATLHGTGDRQCGKAGEECVWTRHLSGTYLVEIAPDPSDNEYGNENARVDYTILRLPGPRLQVSAPNAEGGNAIIKTQ